MIKKAYIAGGCFWGMEELFRTQTGIVDTEVGYMGGKNIDPTYEFHLGHAEAVEISYDDEKTSYEALLDFFFRVHDPTTVDQQGNDMGSSYRSAIFFQDSAEKKRAEEMIQRVNDSELYAGEVVTSLEPFVCFYPAEEYHQDYLQKNPNGYTCHYVRSTESLLL